MNSSFNFVALVEATEAWLAKELTLTPLPLDPALRGAEGTWKGRPVTIETRAYQGGVVRYARIALLKGPGLEIGNLLCLPQVTHPLPILGADLVVLSRETGMVAVDLSPTLPPGPERDAQLASLVARRARQPSLPPGGALPDWCAAWFSPCALYTRVTPSQREAASAAFQDFPSAFVDLARASSPRLDLLAQVASAQAGYAAAHLRDDKGLGLLAKMFGREWSERYLSEVLFPPTDEGSGQSVGTE